MPRQGALVVLIHGLYMNSLCMRPLGHWLRQGGYQVGYFVYPSLRRSPQKNAQALRDFIRSQDAVEVHLVAHSLGGLVVRHLAAHLRDCPPGRVVTLGTPHQGSAVVSRLCQLQLRGLFGHSLEGGLLGDLPPWPRHRELGSLAGVQALGIGRLLGAKNVDSDGTISAKETECPGMRDHVRVPRSHANMLWSREVAEQVMAFLAEGRFTPQAQAMGDIMVG